MKALGLTQEVRPKPWVLRSGGDRGIPSVEVKFVDIGRNTGGEGADLDYQGI